MRGRPGALQKWIRRRCVYGLWSAQGLQRDYVGFSRSEVVAAIQRAVREARRRIILAQLRLDTTRSFESSYELQKL